MKTTELTGCKVDMIERMIATFLRFCMRVFSERSRLHDLTSWSAILGIPDQMQPVPVTCRKPPRYLGSCQRNSANTMPEAGSIYSRLPTR